MESSPFGLVTFQFTAPAVSWRGRLNEYQAHAERPPKGYAYCRRLMRGVRRQVVRATIADYGR